MIPVSWEEAQVTVKGVLALIGVVATVGGIVNLIRGWVKPVKDRETSVDRMLATDKARLDAHEKEIAELREGQKVLCGGLQALLEHELHNGNASEMQEASKALTDWLLNK